MINRKLLSIVGFAVTGAAVPAAIVGGYFGLSSGMYLKYYKAPIDDAPISFINAYKAAVDNGAEIVVAPGFTHKDKIQMAFNEYSRFFKDSGFLLLDEFLTKEDKAAANTFSITFRTDLGTFRTAVAVCYFLNENYEFFSKNNPVKDDKKQDQHLTYGMYGGLPFPSVTSFMGGFQQGVKWFNENMAGGGTSNKPALTMSNGEKFKQVYEYVPVGVNNNFSGGFGPSEGTDLIQSYIKNDNLDIFMPVAGPQLWAAQNAIVQRNVQTLLIGVDSPAEDDLQNLNSPYPEIGNGKYVQFSSEKKLNVAVETVLTIINNGNTIKGLPDVNINKNTGDSFNKKYKDYVDPTDQTGGFGTNAVGTLENGTVGVSKAGDIYYKKAMEDYKKRLEKTNQQFTDPSLNKDLDKPENMLYTFKSSSGKTEQFKYGSDSTDGSLKLKFEDLNPTNRLKKEKFLDSGGKKEDKIKIVLSTATSILMDGSFSQSSYLGMYTWLKKHNVEIPPPPGVNK